LVAITLFTACHELAGLIFIRNHLNEHPNDIYCN
jgi:hypothetical protein